jgi:hypothetical protein
LRPGRNSATKRPMISRLVRRVFNCGPCVIASIAWLVGLAFIWHLTPVGPTVVWRPPTGDYVCGILGDSCTVVTAARVPNRQGAHRARHIRLWDIVTGALLNTRQEPVEGAVLQVCGELLAIEGPIERDERAGTTYRSLWLSDARSGSPAGRFSRPEAPFPAGRYALAPDCRTAAIVAYGNDESRVECYDIKSKRLLIRLAGCRSPICFCSDGTRIAVPSGVDLAVFDIRSDKPMALLEPMNTALAWPAAFSRDGRLLLDNGGNVWDVVTGFRRFTMPQSRAGRSFSYDGRHVIGVLTTGSHVALAYDDVSTGKPVSHTPLSLAVDDSSVYIRPAETSGRWLIITCVARPDTGARWRAWIAKVPFLTSFAQTAAEKSILVDTATGQEVARGTGRWQSCTRDGKRVLGSNNGTEEIWDLSPRRQIVYFWLMGGLYTMAVWFAASYAILRARYKQYRLSDHRLALPPETPSLAYREGRFDEGAVAMSGRCP